MSNLDLSKVNIDEKVVLEKFEGDLEDNNLIERLTIHNGEIVLHEFIENGAVVKSVNPTERSD